MVLDFVQSRIEAFNAEQGGGVAVRKDAHGYTLLHQDSGMPIARRAPGTPATGSRCYTGAPFATLLPVGPLGGMVLSLLDGLEFVANDPMDCFWQ